MIEKRGTHIHFGSPHTDEKVPTWNCENTKCKRPFGNPANAKKCKSCGTARPYIPEPKMDDGDEDQLQ